MLNYAPLGHRAREPTTPRTGGPIADRRIVEQKYGVVVRRRVVHDRFEGLAAHRQLAEVYRALGRYVNSFRPSMKLREKRRDGAATRRRYDQARAPWQGTPVARLNPVIRDWAQYHRHVVRKAVFTTMDHTIFRALWRWSKRRHPGESRRWVRARYFQTRRNDHRVFTGEQDGATAMLVRMASVAIRRHVNIRGTANPYAPADELCFERRPGVAMDSTLHGRRQLLAFWKRQEAHCHAAAN